jgi:hypothetical protein
LIEYGKLVAPRIVLWFYYEGNDLSLDLRREQRSFILPHYLTPGFNQDLANKVAALDEVMTAYLDAILRHVEAGNPTDREWLETATQSWSNDAYTSLLDAVNKIFRLRALRRALGLTHKYPNGAIEYFDRVLTRAQAVVAAWGGRMVFVYLPDEQRFATALGWQDAEAYAVPVRRVVAKLQIPLIDISDTFVQQPNPRSLFRGHYTEEGYRLVGDAVVRALETKIAVDNPVKSD